MAFSHLINCLLLTYGPYFVVYRAKALAEHALYKTVLLALLACLITQFSKLFLLASLSVLSESFLQIKLFFDLIDCYGISVLSKSIRSDHKYSKILAIAIGWAFMDSVLKHLFTLIPNATADEFTWTYILTAIFSNIEFFEIIFLVGLVQKFEHPLCLGLILIKVLALPLLEDLPIRIGASLVYMFISRIMI